MLTATHGVACRAQESSGGVPASYEKAIAELTEAIRFDPKNATNFWERAEARWRKASADCDLAFSGTDDWADAKTDEKQAQGFLTDQYTYAIHLAKKFTADEVTEKYGDKLTLTGHSLGGGLATAGALKYDVPAVVFDPAGVHPNTVGLKTEDDLRKLKRDITVYRVKGEFLTTLQDSNFTRLGYVLPDTIGKQIVDLESDLFLSSIRPFGNHSIEVIIRVLDPNPEEP